MAIRITCIKKDNGFHESPYHAISELGWVNDADSKIGTSTRVQIYDWIIAGGVAYVLDSSGIRTNVITAISPNGTKFLKTAANNSVADNLLALQECR